MANWPTAVGGNEFSIAKLDPETPMTLQVRTWSNLCESGGGVSINAFDEAGKRSSSSFGSIEIESDGDVAHERSHLQGLVDDFNEDPTENWRALIVSARAYVSVFYAKQAAEYAQKAADAARGVFS